MYVVKINPRYQNELILPFSLHPFDSVGSLMVSAGDVVKWLRHLIHVLNDKGDDPEINQLIKDAFQTWVAVPEGHQETTVFHKSEVPEGYGMGWYVSTYNGEQSFNSYIRCVSIQKYFGVVHLQNCFFCKYNGHFI